MPMEIKVLYEFGHCRLDPAQHLLLRDGKPVSLTPKGFELLLVLVLSDGRLLTKDDLMRKLWPDSFVEEANLTVNISALRKALGGTHDGRELIETVPKLGYRFLPAVTELLEENEPAKRTRGPDIRMPLSDPALPAVQIERPSEAPSFPRETRIQRWTRILLPILAMLAIAAVYTMYRQRSPKTQMPAASRRLAILPFQNLRHDPDSDFLGYSLADAVITKLGYVQSLRVRPSYAVAKYRNQNIDIPKVAADLNVNTLLMGNF